ncbi:MATE efflux family protein [Bifidobacterium actinocoloniiforme DSM 22766]|uniref:MATE efflux family protein n=1 Tax=Bifidobacterium actinocoloniiforme DSM 22766 TaxID=1437605 RepID=A0A086Z2D6_9BIFI|nr:MATE family efflux transporter [Bifidobacterium actinocoloniiforme]AKV55692.1 multidrug transporter MatE [Bifidobacterium actinocoloniiforme DSM 22766]KFI40686.1 MATE efflux family protein [Bifidobacterium actinocoloniiforme DSM 22766]
MQEQAGEGQNQAASAGTAGPGAVTEAGTGTGADKRSVYRQIAALAVPTFGQLIAEPAFVMIDTAIVGHISDAALAGLSIGSTVVLTTVGLCVFLAYGTTSQVARLMGAGKRKEGMEVGVDGMWLAFAIGILVCAALVAASEPLCWLMGARGPVLAAARVYLNATIFGLPAMLLVYAANGIFRGLQKVRITLFAAVSGAVLNTVLEVLLVFGLRWGIAGSGAATLIAEWYMGLFLTIPALVWAKREGASWKPRLAGILSSAGDGLPLFLRTLALRVCLAGTVVAAAHLGEQVLAAYQGVNSAWNFGLNMLDAVGIAGQSLVATELGARHKPRARMMTGLSAKAGMVMGVLVGLVMIALGLFAAPLFSPTPAVRSLITVGMAVEGVFMPIAGWMWALDGILIGAGDYRYLAATCSSTALIYVAALTPLTLWAQTWASQTWRIVMLWSAINFLFIGARAIFNGLRARGDAWMDRALASV